MFKIKCITTNKKYNSIFTEVTYEKNDRNGLIISEQIGAKNFRLRESKVGYSTNWHLAGDPTLIIIQKGTLRITLQNNQFIDFEAGEQFIATDNLPENIAFDSTIHGHKASVIGEENLMAIHIKLDNWKV